MSIRDGIKLPLYKNIFGAVKSVFNDHPWASADFFPGEGKIFQGGKNILFFSLIVKKHTIMPGHGGGGKSLLLPSPADAHVTTLGSPKLWALLRGGRCSEVALGDKKLKLGLPKK